MKKYFTVALVAGALFSFTTASAMNCLSANENLTTISKEKKEKKSKKDKKAEETKKGCQGKTSGSGCCAGAKKAS